MISAGEFIQASGTWINDRTNGVQFKPSFLKAAPPTTIEGIEKYLGSGMIRGIWPVYPNVESTFYETVFDISVEEPIAIKSPPRNERIAPYRIRARTSSRSTLPAVSRRDPIR
jgi:exodeoxyribonuclease V alpha subunit